MVSGLGGRVASWPYRRFAAFDACDAVLESSCFDVRLEVSLEDLPGVVVPVRMGRVYAIEAHVITSTAQVARRYSTWPMGDKNRDWPR